MLTGLEQADGQSEAVQNQMTDTAAGRTIKLTSLHGEVAGEIGRPAQQILEICVA